MGLVWRMCQNQPLLLGSLVVFSLISQSYGSPLNVLAAPNLLRVGTTEKVFVEIQDMDSKEAVIAVTIKVLNHPTKKTTLVQTSVTLNQGNKFQAFGSITIPSENFIEDSKQKQYVYLQAVFPDQQLEKVALVSFQTGYIFIQTDKSLYTPESSVLYRVFVMTPDMHLLDTRRNTSTSVVIEMVTSDGITIYSKQVSVYSGMYSDNYKLGEMVSIGVWKVVARFGSNKQQAFSTEFEVKEYVLPSFEVKLTPESTFFYMDSKQLVIDIKARYLFGKEVFGTAYVVFGVILEEKRESFPSSLQRVEISTGAGRAILTRDHITQSFPNIEVLKRRSIYVAVSVLTESGSEMVEAELNNIMIVKSPYTINFKKSRKYFRPGTSFEIVVEALTPDGTPAKNLHVVINDGEQDGYTGENGLARLTVNSEENFRPLTFTARTDDPDIDSDRQASASMTVHPYTSESNNYIHIGVGVTEVKAGQNLIIRLSTSRQQETYDVTYLILSRGQLVKHGRYKIRNQHMISLTIPVIKEMLPSFRIVAYYHTGDNEVVSDSVWVDVEDSCMGSLTLEVLKPEPYYQPRSIFDLKITGDPGATVGLVAVDKAVYVLNNKHRLTQKKVWDVMETYDTGCTSGGGSDGMNVFFDAGLLFQTNSASGTPYRTELKCPTLSRKKRSINPVEVRNRLEHQYNNTLQRECCLDGMREIPVSYSCQRRSEYIGDGPACVEAFLHCCTAMEHQRAEIKHETLQLARSDDGDGYEHGNEISSRTYFPESWFWNTYQLDPCGENKFNCKTKFIEKKNIPIPDSITTWLFAAVSLSATHGICVAEPFELIVKKKFHIDLRLPYVAVHGEQLEVRAILHNDTPELITVRVDLIEQKGICSSAYKRGKSRQIIKMREESTRSVSFILIPMKTGNLPVQVKAVVEHQYLSDMIEKDLRVVPEGTLVKTVKRISLNPTKKGGKQEEIITNNISENHTMVPNSPMNTYIYLTGKKQMDSMLENAISGKSMGSLIYQPSGCGEQNMIHMTLPVIATTYLDNTNQWENVGFERRDEALQHIITGFNNQLYYRNNDGSYSVFHNDRNSTWLTAYVAKVFAMAKKLVELDLDVICHAIKFLTTKTQEPDGMFTEVGYVSSGRIMDNVAGSDRDASMTAFCLIAMQESRHLCSGTVNNLQDSINKAVSYLEHRLPTITNPYAVTMTSYALANENKLNKTLLMQFASSDLSHWSVPGEKAYTLEATAYALLALVKVKAFEEAKPIVTWLNQQKNEGGGYGSTQATIMVYQAVAEYWTTVEEPPYDMDVNILISGRKKGDRFTIRKNSRFATRSSKFSGLNKHATVSANGTGEAVLEIVTAYYTLPRETENNCEMFNVTVQLNEELEEDTGKTYKLTIKVLFKDKERNASMSILDIGLATGFTFNKKDLDALSNGRDRSISKYEMNKVLSEKGSVIIYLDKITSQQPEIISFKLHQEMNVGILQPAAVSVYEYNNRKPCVKFYHPDRASGALERLCRGVECTCAEENCSVQTRNQVDNATRILKSCEATEDSRIDFVYKIRVEEFGSEFNTDFYKVLVEEVIKGENTDVNPQNERRTFIGSQRCRKVLDISTGKTYLIMGASRDIRKNDRLRTYEYVFGEKDWIEYWPTTEECLTEEYQPICKGIEDLKKSWTDVSGSKSPCRS